MTAATETCMSSVSHGATAAAPRLAAHVSIQTGEALMRARVRPRSTPLRAREGLTDAARPESFELVEDLALLLRALPDTYTTMCERWNGQGAGAHRHPILSLRSPPHVDTIRVSRSRRG